MFHDLWHDAFLTKRAVLLCEWVADTEEEVIEGEAIFCTGEGLALDLQPGKIVCSGPHEGQELVLELVPVVQGGKAYLQAQSMTLDGEDAPPQDLAETNEALAEDSYDPEEDYTVTAFTITHDSLTITSTLTSTLSEAELATLTAPLPTATPPSLTCLMATMSTTRSGTTMTAGPSGVPTCTFRSE